MIRHCTFVGIVAFLFSVYLSIALPFNTQAGFFGADKPKAKELKEATRLEFAKKGYIELDKFDAEILENMGNKVDPRWGSRFKALVKNKVPGYVFEKKENKITFIKLKSEVGTKVEVYGKIFSTLFQGKWKHEFEIDGNPFREIGKPKENFNGNVILIGSEEHNNYIAEQKELARKRQELKRNVARAQKILIGTWETNWPWAVKKDSPDKMILILYPDQTYNVYIDEKHAAKGTWWVKDGKYGYREKGHYDEKRDKWRYVTRPAYEFRFLSIYDDNVTLRRNSRNWIWEKINNETPSPDLKVNPKMSKEEKIAVPKQPTPKKTNNTSINNPKKNREIITLDWNPTTSTEKTKEAALKLVAFALEKGKTGIEKAVSWENKVLFGTTISKTYKGSNNYTCREYTIVSYTSGQEKTKINSKACRVKGKWYPYKMLQSKDKKVSGDQYREMLIGSDW